VFLGRCVPRQERTGSTFCERKNYARRTAPGSLDPRALLEWIGKAYDLR
jgi:hypothetical protein